MTDLNEWERYERERDLDALTRIVMEAVLRRAKAYEPTEIKEHTIPMHFRNILEFGKEDSRSADACAALVTCYLVTGQVTKAIKAAGLCERICREIPALSQFIPLGWISYAMFFEELDASGTLASHGQSTLEESLFAINHIRMIDQNLGDMHLAEYHIKRGNVSQAIQLYLRIVKEGPKGSRFYPRATEKLKELL